MRRMGQKHLTVELGPIAAIPEALARYDLSLSEDGRR